MGEILRVRNLKICIYPKDHYPPHVHVIGPEAEAKFTLTDFTCVSSFGFRKKTIVEIAKFLREHEQLLLEAWNENQE